MSRDFNRRREFLHEFILGLWDQTHGTSAWCERCELGDAKCRTSKWEAQGANHPIHDNAFSDISWAFFFNYSIISWELVHWLFQETIFACLFVGLSIFSSAFVLQPCCRSGSIAASTTGVASAHAYPSIQQEQQHVVERPENLLQQDIVCIFRSHRHVKTCRR